MAIRLRIMVVSAVLVAALGGPGGVSAQEASPDAATTAAIAKWRGAAPSLDPAPLPGGDGASAVRPGVSTRASARGGALLVASHRDAPRVHWSDSADRR